MFIIPIYLFSEIFPGLFFLHQGPFTSLAATENHKNRDISATVWPIFTKFGTLVQNGPLTAPTIKKSNFTNTRWLTAAILRTVESPYLVAVWPILMKFGIGLMTPIGPLQRKDHYNFEFLKIQDGGSRHLENHKNRDICTTVWPIFTKFGTLMQNGSLNHPEC